jgi:hypothetical protein
MVSGDAMSWELRAESLQALDQRLTVLQPSLIVEAGSGQSTVILSKHGRTVSLEHLRKYARRSKQLAPNAEIRLCPIKPFHTLVGNFRWYATTLPPGIDFALIDGPPMSVGREAALFALWPHLSKGWEIWLDDADRSHEQACLKLWSQYFPFHVEPINEWVVRLRN